MHAFDRSLLGCLLATLAVALVVTACGNSEEPKTISQTRTVGDPGPSAMPEMNTAERLGVRTPSASGELPPGHPPIGDASAAPAMPGAGAPAPSGLAWQAPESWAQEAPRAMRLVSFKIGPNQEAECYVTVLAGTGGGIEANINRWRSQMGAPPLSASAIEGLPKIEILGGSAPLVEIAGNFSGMGGAAQSGAVLLGTIAEFGGQAVFVKMTGPEEVTRTEKENFIAFCKSLKQP